LVDNKLTKADNLATFDLYDFNYDLQTLLFLTYSELCAFY